MRTRLRLAQTFPADLLAETLRLAERCAVSLDELKCQYPDEVVRQDKAPAGYLRRITYEGAGRCWPEGVPARVETQQIEHELQLIAEMPHGHYFLTVYDVVSFAGSQLIRRPSGTVEVTCVFAGEMGAPPGSQPVM